MRNSVVTKRAGLLSSWTLLLVAVLVGALLVMTHRSEDVFLPAGKEPDAVSINYAQLLLAAHPEDQQLRLTLIEQLIELGDYPRARRHLQGLSADDIHLPFYRLELDVLEALADPAGIGPRTKQALMQGLQGIDLNGLSNAQLGRQAKYALALSMPGLAAQAYVELSKRDSQQHFELLGEAAKWYLAAGDAEHTAAVYLQLMKDAPLPAQRLGFLQQAFVSLRAADHGEQAAELMAQHLDDMRDMPAEIRDAVLDTALGSHRFDLAERFVRAWRSWNPEDQHVLAMEFRLYLASDNVERAWASGRLLLALRPNDLELLAQMARLGEGSGHPREALDYWLQILQQMDDAAIREHAWRLATQLFDFNRAIPLLAVLAEQRRLSDEELEVIVYSHQTRGTPEQGEAWLRSYLHRYPAHQLAWQRLQQILEHTQHYAKEAQIWAELDRRFGLTVAQRVSWSQVHWKLFDLESAWAVLTDLDSTQVTDAEYWQLRAELAWELERDDEVRLAYERLQALGVQLDSSGEEQLIQIYNKQAPEKALALLAESWRRKGDPRRLGRALQLAEQLGDWAQLRQLVKQASRLPGAQRIPALLGARGVLANRAGRPDEAERLYRQGLRLFPQTSQFRQSLLWLYIDRGQRDKLLPLLLQWRGVAQEDGELWLPFASANLMLNRAGQALAWFRLYLNSNPGDWLVQSAYADALDSAGYTDQARRLRTYLLARIEPQRLTGGRARYDTYLRLLGSTHSPRRAARQGMLWRDGSRPMLQIWFEQFLVALDAANQGALKSDWLAWAHSQGLQISDYEQLQEALRVHDRSRLERWRNEGGLDSAQRVEILALLGHGGEALGEGLSNLSDEQVPSVSQQLLQKTVELHERTPQGLQLGWQSRDFGGLELKGPTLELARHLGNDWYADLNLDQGRYDADTLDDSVLGNERNLDLRLLRELSDGRFALTLDASWRDDEDRLGFGVSRSLALSSRDVLQIDLDWRREADETGLMRALGMRDGLSLAGQHGLTARDQLSWSLAHRRFSTRQGDALGRGEQVDLEYSHALFFEGPTWLLRSGLSYQRNRLENRLDEDLLASRLEADGSITALDGALRQESATPADLLQDRFGQVYVGSTWRRGLPGALNRGRGQYTWLLDVMAGWQWTEQEFNYAITTGIGMEVLGDDELAFTVGYQSAPQNGDGEAGGTLGITYSARFGR